MPKAPAANAPAAVSTIVAATSQPPQAVPTTQASASARPSRRVALVLGNSRYTVSPLANPVNDATAVARTLDEVGFDKVLLRQNLSLEGMRAALREFNREVGDADIALVYYAGHGIEVAGRNFLVPLDARLARAADVDLETISLDTLLGQLDGARKLKLVILDACRNNIFPVEGAKRSLSRGLARVEPEDNTLVAFAAAAGATAEDGSGSQHSPFTAALLKHLRTPALDVRLLLGKIRDEVMASTGRRQQPYHSGTLGGDEIVLVPKR